MSLWEDREYRENWFAKTRNKYKLHYDFQMQEVLHDLDTIDPLSYGSYLDVGGGEGRFGLGKVIDLQNGFDLTRSWSDQGLDQQYDIVFTSLALIAMPPDKVDFVVSEMFRFAKRYIYLFEEASVSEELHGNPLDGGKWQYNFEKLFKGYPCEYFKIRQAKSNPAWDKITIKLNPPEVIL